LLEKVKGYDSAIAEASKRLLTQLQERRSYEKVGFVFSGNTNKLDEISAVLQAKTELASMGLGSVVGTMNPTLARYLGPNAIGMSIINDDISVTDLAEIK